MANRVEGNSIATSDQGSEGKREEERATPQNLPSTAWIIINSNKK